VGGVVQAIDRCGAFQIFNLGESQTTSLEDLVVQIGAACGKEPVLERLPNQPGDVPVTYADISHAREILAYDPRVPVAEGLERFVRWYRGCP